MKPTAWLTRSPLLPALTQVLRAASIATSRFPPLTRVTHSNTILSTASPLPSLVRVLCVASTHHLVLPCSLAASLHTLCLSVRPCLLPPGYAPSLMSQTSTLDSFPARCSFVARRRYLTMGLWGYRKRRRHGDIGLTLPDLLYRPIYQASLARKLTRCVVTRPMSRHEALFGMARWPDMLCLARPHQFVLLPSSCQPISGSPFGCLYITLKECLK
jgi:hypothetical protein